MEPRPYTRKTSKLWWLGQRHSTIYILRELTSAFIGAYALVLLVGMFRLSQGAPAYAAYLATLQTPLAIAFHFLALAFAVFHTVTWFGLTPKAMPLRFGGRAVPAAAIILAHYALWFLVSSSLLLLAWGW